MILVFITASIAIFTFILAILPDIEAWRAERSWNQQFGAEQTTEPRKP